MPRPGEHSTSTFPIFLPWKRETPRQVPGLKRVYILGIRAATRPRALGAPWIFAEAGFECSSGRITDESGIRLKFSGLSLGVSFESLRTNGCSRMIEVGWPSGHGRHSLSLDIGFRGCQGRDDIAGADVKPWGAPPRLAGAFQSSGEYPLSLAGGESGIGDGFDCWRERIKNESGQPEKPQGLLP